jgi:hypothetical protein
VFKVRGRPDPDHPREQERQGAVLSHLRLPLPPEDSDSDSDTKHDERETYGEKYPGVVAKVEAALKRDT